MLQEIFDLFRAREPVPFIILAFWCAGFMIIIERLILLQFVYRVNFGQFNQSLRKMLAAGDLERARAFCAATSKAGLPLIAAKAIDAYQTDTLKVRMLVSEEALLFLPRIRRRIAQIPNLATASVLLGALAVVNGVWQSFQAVDVVDMGVKSFVFAKGLSHSLTPLALALAVAALLMLPYGLLDAMASRLEGELEHSLTMILNILAPESQTFVSAQAMAGAPNFAAHDGARGGAGLGGAADGLSMGAGGDLGSISKGISDDVASERAEQIPDEEEII